METSRAVGQIKYQVFGSSSSLDLDVCFFVDSIGNIEENNGQLNYILEHVNLYSDKKVNGNLAVLGDGVVLDCFKGIADELNNSLFTTYALHEQKFDNQILKVVERNLELKMIRCARTIVSYFTRTHLRTEAKAALRGGFKQKVDFLTTINLDDFKDFGTHGSVLEIYKSMAFQLGQTIGLMRGEEYYTKEAMAEKYLKLNDYLFRVSCGCSDLKEYLNVFIEESLKRMPEMEMMREIKK